MQLNYFNFHLPYLSSFPWIGRKRYFYYIDGIMKTYLLIKIIYKPRETRRFCLKYFSSKLRVRVLRLNYGLRQNKIIVWDFSPNFIISWFTFTVYTISVSVDQNERQRNDLHKKRNYLMWLILLFWLFLSFLMFVCF